MVLFMLQEELWQQYAEVFWERVVRDYGFQEQRLTQVKDDIYDMTYQRWRKEIKFQDIYGRNWMCVCVCVCVCV